MKRILNGAAAVAVLVGLAACGETTTGPDATSSLSAAFVSQLAGFGNTLNSFGASADSMMPWGPGDHDGDRGDHHGGMGEMGHSDRGHHGGGPGDMMLGGGMMGGGLGDLFRGLGFGPAFGHGPHGDSALTSCIYDAGTARLTCATDTHDGITINRSIALEDANGNPQQAFDSITTNSINERVTVTGTITRRDGAVSTVDHASDRTVAGLAKASTQRTVNGTSAGRESTTGTDSAGTFSVLRTMGDTTVNVVIPVVAQDSTSRHPYPVSGTVIRSMAATVTHAGTTTSTSRREVITYDGSSTAKVTITQDGTTKSCTIALPHGRLTCS